MAARTFAVPVINVPTLKDTETRQALIAITRQTEKWLRLANQKIDENSGNRGTPQVVSDVAELQAQTQALAEDITDLTNQLTSLVADQAAKQLGTAPVIEDFTNAQHAHTSAAGGGQLTSAALLDYTTGSFIVTATGFVLPAQGVATYVKFANLVTLFIPTLSGTSNATTMTLTGIPSAIQTTSEAAMPVFVGDNGNALGAPGSIVLRTAGTPWDVYTTGNNGGFNGSGIKTLYATYLTYHIM